MNDATLAQMVAALQAENQQLRDWREAATVACAKRRCATRDRDLKESESENERLRQLYDNEHNETCRLRAEVASWKRLADIQEGSLKESCAEVERLKAVMDDPLNSGEWHNPDDLVAIRRLKDALSVLHHSILNPGQGRVDLIRIAQEWYPLAMQPVLPTGVSRE